MFNRKKSLSAFLGVLLFFSTSINALGDSLVEPWVDKAWSKVYQEEVNLEHELRRVDFLALVNSRFEFKNKVENTFKDLDQTKPYFNEVLKALGENLVKGNGRGDLRPEEKIKKGEAYAILSRALKDEDLKEYKHIHKFKDIKDTPKWIHSPIEKLCNRGLLIDKNKVKVDESLSLKDSIDLIEKAYASLNQGEPKSEDKTSGKKDLNYLAAHIVTIDKELSKEIKPLKDEIKIKDGEFLRLTFDRGMVRDNWEHNKEQIQLLDGDREVEINVFNLGNTDTEKSHIFIKVLESLDQGKLYKLLIKGDIKANNGNALGEDTILEFKIK